MLCFVVLLAGLVACSPFCLLADKAWHALHGTQVWACIQCLGRLGSWCLLLKTYISEAALFFYWENCSRFVMLCCFSFAVLARAGKLSQAVCVGTPLLHLPAERQSEEKLASVVCTLHQHQLCEEVPQLFKCHFAKTVYWLLNFLTKMLLRDCALSYCLNATMQ